jgi:hypothetical protein
MKILSSTGFDNTQNIRHKIKKIGNETFVEYYTGSNKYDIKYNLEKVRIAGFHYRKTTNKWDNTTIWIRK